ncbi:MAG: monovalent cation/H+ antiporter complex subunit F [Planctomycetota bacterium]
MATIFCTGLIICCFLCLYRIARGPTAADRIVSIDILGIVIVGFCAIIGYVTGKDFYLNIALAWALLSFIGTLALAKFLEGRNFDD